LKSESLELLEPSEPVLGLHYLYIMDCDCTPKNIGIFLSQVKRLRLAKSKEETADLRNVKQLMEGLWDVFPTDVTPACGEAETDVELW
jgi:hypothetical protein